MVCMVLELPEWLCLCVVGLLGPQTMFCGVLQGLTTKTCFTSMSSNNPPNTGHPCLPLQPDSISISFLAIQLPAGDDGNWFLGMVLRSLSASQANWFACECCPNCFVAVFGVVFMFGAGYLFQHHLFHLRPCIATPKLFVVWIC